MLFFLFLNFTVCFPHIHRHLFSWVFSPLLECNRFLCGIEFYMTACCNCMQGLLLIGSWFVLLLNQPLMSREVTWVQSVVPKDSFVLVWFIGGWFLEDNVRRMFCCVGFSYVELLKFCCYFVNVFCIFPYLRQIKRAQSLLMINPGLPQAVHIQCSMDPCPSWNKTPLNNQVSMKTSLEIHYEHTSAITFLILANVLLVPWASY